MMKFDLKTRILSFILCITLLASVIPAGFTLKANAAGFDNAQIPQNDYPDNITPEDISEYGLISRDKESEESLYSYVFNNKNGEKTELVYSYPVKYKDVNGEVKDKSKKLVEKEDKIISESNEYNLTLNKNVKDGVLIEYKDYSVSMIPLFDISVPTVSEDAKSALYEAKDFYLKYSLNFDGIKEDIVLEKYDGVNAWSYRVLTNGLTLKDENGTLVLMSEKEKVMTLGSVFCFSENEKNNTIGFYTIETVKDSSEYLLTVNAPENWLKDEKTEYPVTIDPSFTIYDDSEYKGIHDFSIGPTDAPSKSNDALYIGKNSSHGAQRAFISLPNETFTHLSITSAKLELRDIMCNSSPIVDVECYEYLGDSWSESNAPSWADASNYGELLDKKYVKWANGDVPSDVQRYSFDITPLAKKWSTGTASPGAGLLLKVPDEYENGNSDYMAFFASDEYGAADKRPSLIITYVDPMGLNQSYSYDVRTIDDKLSVYNYFNFGNTLVTYNFDTKTKGFPLELFIAHNNRRNYWNLSLDIEIYPENNQFVYMDGYQTEYIFTYNTLNGKYENEILDAEIHDLGNGRAKLFINDIEILFDYYANQTISITYDGNVFGYNYGIYGITSIEKNGSDLFTFTYDNNGRLSSAFGYTITYFRSIYIGSIVDKYGNSIDFDYRNFNDTLHELDISSSLTQNGIKVYYYLNRATEIASYKGSLANKTEDEIIEYNGNETSEYSAFNNIDENDTRDAKTVYYFDNTGKTIETKIYSVSTGTLIYEPETEEEPEEEYQDTGLSFTSNGDGTCYVSGIGTCEDTDIIIPEKAPNGDNVTAIGAEAFRGNASITSVSGSSVLTIGENAFRSCTNLESIYFDEITRIYYNAFMYCSKLKRLNLPDTLTRIDSVAFGNCTSLEKVSIPCSVTYLGTYVFDACTDLRIVTIPRNITSLPNYAFSGATNLFIYYEGSQSEWQNVTKGTGAVPVSATIKYNAPVKYGSIYEKDSNGITTVTSLDADSFIEYYRYDNNGNITFYEDAQGNEYYYTYDQNDNILSYSSNGRSISYTYNSLGDVLTETDSLGNTTTYSYYSNGLISDMSRGITTVHFTYSNGDLSTVTVNNETYTYTYNVYGNITEIKIGNIQISSYTYTIGGLGNLRSKTQNGYTEYFSYDAEGNLIEDEEPESGDETEEEILAELPENVESEAITDSLNRETEYALKILGDDIYTVSRTFLDGNTSYAQSETVTESFSNGSTFTYHYNANGNLTEVWENGVRKIRYFYYRNQILREDNLYDNATYTWSYDANGNITEKLIYPYCNDGIRMPIGSVPYSYGNTDCKDLLTLYNGQAISYNGLYPTNWRNISGITWEGSKLTSFLNSGNDRVYYTYDEDGHRILKNRCAVLTHYYWTDGKISGQSDYRGTLDFFYDGDDIKGFTYNNANFYYGKDSFGVIRYIYDESGNIVTTYTYDAWGRQVSVTGSNVTLGNLNPIRYKSYFYDTDTGFYYLETRFYDPTVGRFISPDDPAYLGASGSALGWNLYSYCENNPVLGSDANGHMAAAIVVSDYVLAQFISWLTVIASSNCWNVVGWVVAAVIAAGAITYGAVTLYNKWKTKEASKTKILKNTINAIIPKKEKPYYFAYIDPKGCLVKSGKGMSFVEALTCLGVKKAAETLKSNYKVKIKNPFGSKDWGIYAKNQAYAKALAVALGNKKPPEIHESGYYGHYHDGKHKIHIWFGTCIYY